MNWNARFLLSITLALFFCITNANAQLVNMEVTWQEFLKNKKTSDISDLVKPEKTQPANYIKYCLIYANKYFCGDNVSEADNMMAEIEAMGKSVWDRVDGFEARYEGLKKKIAAYKSLDPVWERFIEDKNSVTRDEVEQYPAAKKVCERGTLCKYFYMISHDYFCDKDLRNARQVYDSRIKKLVATTFDPDAVEGLGDEVRKMAKFWDGMDELEPAWDAYVESGVSPGMDAELPIFRCYVIPNMQACVLKAMYDICGEGEEMLNQLKDLQEMSTYPVPMEITDAMEEIELQVRNIKKDLTVLNTFWRKFLRSNKLPSGANFKHEFACDREAEIKAYLMDGLDNPCVAGTEALENISRIRKEHRPDLGAQTSEKLKELKNLMRSTTTDTDALTTAWDDFVPDDQLSQNFTLVTDYCDKLAQLRAFIIDGTVNICTNAQDRLDDIDNLMDEYDIDVDAVTQEKLDALSSKSSGIAQKTKDLNKAWDYFVDNGEVSDDLEYDYGFPCDRILDVKAYLLDGYTNPCLSGKYGLGEVQKVINEYRPKLTSEVNTYIEELKEQIKNEKENVATLTRAWEDFVPDDKLAREIDFVFSYCDKIAECRAYLIDGTVNFCTVGKKRLADISQLQEDYLLTFDRTMEQKVEALHQRGTTVDQEVEDLRKVWQVWVDTEDPAKVRALGLYIGDTYCNPMDQARAWVLFGLNDVCGSGDGFLAKIEYLQQKEQIRFDSTLEGQIDTLRKRIKECE